MSNIELGFPDTYLETGKDDDHSFMSIKTTRQSDGSLKIDVEGWGITEHGLMLFAAANGDVMEMRILGRCGSVFNETWLRVSFSRTLERETEEQLQRIEYKREKRLTIYKESPPTISPRY
jgi:hypothetical protein